MIKLGESGHPVFRATSPLSRGTLKSKGGGKLSIQFCADGETIVTVFRTIISVNQLSIYGAVPDLCVEDRACQAKTGRLVLAGQSDPLFEPASLLMKTPTPSTEDPVQEDLLQKYQERVDEMWKSKVAKGGGNKNKFQCCTDPSGEILYLRALQGHSGRNPIDPSLQDNVLVPDNFFEYIYRIGFAVNSHSITNSGL